MVIRDFSPDEPKLQQIIGAGGLVFRALHTPGVIAIRQTLLDGVGPIAIIEELTYDSPALEELLQAASVWRIASGLKHMVVGIPREGEQRQKIEAAGYTIRPELALVSITRKELASESDSGTTEDHSASESPEPEIPAKSPRPARTKANPRPEVPARKSEKVDSRPRLNIGARPGVDSD